MTVKKILAMVIALAAMLTMLAGCGDDSEDEANGSTYEYKYVVRDLPEPKYITPAEAFAGGSGTAADPYQIADAAQLALLTTDNDKASDKNIQAKDAVLKISNCTSTCTMVVNEPGAEEYTDYIGGVIGNASAADGFSILVTRCTYSGADRGLGNTDLPDVGTKK